MRTHTLLYPQEKAKFLTELPGGERVRFATFDLKDASTAIGAICGCEAVFHCASPLSSANWGLQVRCGKRHVTPAA